MISGAYEAQNGLKETFQPFQTIQTILDIVYYLDLCFLPMVG